MMNYLTEFGRKAFQSVAKADESIENPADEVDENAKEAEKALEPPWSVSSLPGDRVKEVRPDASFNRHAGDCQHRCG